MENERVAKTEAEAETGAKAKILNENENVIQSHLAEATQNGANLN